MAGTLDSAIDQKKNQQSGKEQQKVADSGGPGEGDSSATKSTTREATQTNKKP